MATFLNYAKTVHPIYLKFWQSVVLLRTTEIQVDKVDIMGRELQSQNRVDVDYEKTTSLIYLKFWQSVVLQSTTEFQKMKTLALKLTDLWLLTFQN